MIQAICWTLVHSLWQGLLFAIIAGMAMLLTRRTSAAVRYNVLCGLFFLFLILCSATFVYEWSLAGQLTKEGIAVATMDGDGRMAAWIDALGRYCSTHAVPIVWGWLFIFAIKSLHMLGSYLYVQRIRHYGISAAPGDWQDRIDLLSQQMGIRRTVRLVESRIVKMPILIGHLRPIILMPLGLITGLPQGEIEAVLLHELAHIRRNDYIVNFLQNVAVNFFFFNPGLLWMSSMLREERENCCDDIAIARTRDRAGFIRALISFKEHDLRLAGVVNAFPGKKDQLVKRAMRIAQHTNKTLDPAEKIFLVLSFILISVLVAATSGSSPASPARVTQIPGGKYTFFVDTPVRKVQTHYIVRDEQELPETKEPLNTSLAEARLQMETSARNILAVRQAMKDMQLARDDEAAMRAKKQAVENIILEAWKSEQAAKDAKQALRDDEQRRLDHEQSIRDRQQAIRDHQQALMDGIQAERNEQQARRDKEMAELDAIKADQNKQQTERNVKLEKAMKDRSQAGRDKTIDRLLDKLRAEQVEAVRINSH